VLIFEGMGTDRCYPKDEAFLQGFKDKLRELKSSAQVETKCVAPPLHTSITKLKEARHWADYAFDRSVSQEEAEYKYRNETHVPDWQRQLKSSLTDDLWSWVKRQADQGKQGVLVGTSNGAVAASAVALYLSERYGMKPHLVLLSGLPAYEQCEDLRRIYSGSVGSIVMTVASQERYFGGIPTFYSFAGWIFADVKTFEGTHAHEPEELTRKLGKHVAKQLEAHR